MKFSIIIPVYNTEKYLKRCIESVLNQTYQNFEIIIINDGSKDKSEEILKNYETNTKIKIIKQINHGVSYSRNVGIQKAKGDYIIFLDSDDLLEKDLLETINKNTNNEDMIKFSYCDLKNNEKIKRGTITFNNLTGKEAFKKLVESKTMFEMAWLYAYKKSYMQKYKFEIGKYHEDLGLIPLMINKTKSITSINYNGYIYNRDNETSITSYTGDKKEYKKALDVLYFFKKIKSQEKDKYLLSFYANAVILKESSLSGENKKEYSKEIKKEKIYNYILDNTIKRKIKKIIIKAKYIFTK
ncbi:MAG: glycosyltransferase [Bacilli bacterium]|nr:glycosyltransferase [Bacilli bacterium]